MIQFTEHETRSGLKNKIKIREGLKRLIASEGKKAGAITYVFCTDAYLSEMNSKYLKHNTLTDIITFNYNENDSVAGDILISTERVKENAEKYKVSYDDELLRVMAHGVLHLLGYRDKSKEEKETMRSKEEESIALIKNVEMS